MKIEVNKEKLEKFILDSLWDNFYATTPYDVEDELPDFVEENIISDMLVIFNDLQND